MTGSLAAVTVMSDDTSESVCGCVDSVGPEVVSEVHCVVHGAVVAVVFRAFTSGCEFVA